MTYFYSKLVHRNLRDQKFGQKSFSNPNFPEVRHG